MKNPIAWNNIHNPIIDREPAIALRDPALVFDQDIFYLFHTAVEYQRWQYHFYLDLCTSPDLQHWSPAIRVISVNAGFSSPGNVLRVNNHWLLCVQTYPVDRFSQYGNDTCRLWLMEGDSLIHWNAPYLIQPQGCTAPWTKSPRQIDPFLVAFEDKFWCFYKAEGKLGLLVSSDLHQWVDALDTPVLSSKNVPDHTALENVCVIQDKDQFRMFFSPCDRKRGVGVAISSDLTHWQFDRYLEFPKLTWAESGPTAPSVLDLRSVCGKWVMVFHADRKLPHGAAMGLAWSDDLLNWQTE